MKKPKVDKSTWTKEHRKLWRDFAEFVLYVESGIDGLDMLMGQPSSVVRGEKVAELLNGLEMATIYLTHHDLELVSE